MEIKDYSIHTTKKTNGRYYGRIIYRDTNGKRHEKSAGGFKLKKDATQHAQEVLQSMLSSVNLNHSDISLYDYYIKWYDLYKKQNITKTTRNRYVVVGNVLKNHFGSTPLSDIKRSDYQELMNEYGSTHARDSVSKFNNIVRKCVSYAIDDEIIEKDFTHNVQLVANKDREIKVEYLSNQELKTLRRAVVANLNHYNTSRYMILTALLTGMRKGEIQALTWNDIDFIHQTITIHHSWDDVQKCFKPTKTESSNRVIKVNIELLDRLQELRANGTTMVFQNVLGTIPTSTALNKCLRSIMADCGIHKRNFHFHSLRHCHVAYLLSKGIDVYAISKRLGHSNIDITMKVYAYPIKEFMAQKDKQIVSELANL